jgi:hypothetical protein
MMNHQQYRLARNNQGYRPHYDEDESARIAYGDNNNNVMDHHNHRHRAAAAADDDDNDNNVNDDIDVDDYDQDDVVESRGHLHLILDDEDDGIIEDESSALPCSSTPPTTQRPLSTHDASNGIPFSSSSAELQPSHSQYLHYSDAATMFAESACTSICVVSAVLKQEAEVVKRRVQAIQDRLPSPPDVQHNTKKRRHDHDIIDCGNDLFEQQDKSGSPNKKIKLLVTDKSEIVAETASTYDEDDSTIAVQGDDQSRIEVVIRRDTNVPSDSDSNNVDVSAVDASTIDKIVTTEEQQSIRKQTYRMKRISNLLRHMDQLNIQLLFEMKQCAVSAAMTAAAVEEQALRSHDI